LISAAIQPSKCQHLFPKRHRRAVGVVGGLLFNQVVNEPLGGKFQLGLIPSSQYPLTQFIAHNFQIRDESFRIGGGAHQDCAILICDTPDFSPGINGRVIMQGKIKGASRPGGR
jgi:hypothetical protein